MITFRQLCEVCGYKRTVMAEVIRAEDFPKPYNLTGTPWGRRWDEAEVRAYLDSKKQAA